MGVWGYAVLLLLVFFVLMACGVPISFSLAISAIITVIASGQFQVIAVVQRMI